MFSRRVQEEEPPKPKLHVFGVEGDDLGGLMHQCRERDPRLRRNAEDKAKAAISPFVELRCAGQTFRTSRQSHDIDPVWPDASFFFGGDGEHEPLEPDDDGEHVVECVVFSSGVLRPREIGRAKVPYHDLVSGKLKGIASWVELTAPEEPVSESEVARRQSSASAVSTMGAAAAAAEAEAALDGSEKPKPRYLGRLRMCMQMVDYNGPNAGNDQLRPVQLRVKVLRGRGLVSTAGAAAASGRADSEVNPLVRLMAPSGQQLSTRTLQRTAEPEWGNREEFLFPAPSEHSKVLLQVETAQGLSGTRVMGTLSLEAKYFTMLPGLLLHSRLEAQADVMRHKAATAARIEAAQAAKAAASAPGPGPASSSSAVKEGASPAASASRARHGKPGRRGASSGSGLADGEPDPTVSRVAPLSALGAVGVPSADGVVDGLPVYTAPVETWFALRGSGGEDDGEYRGEVQLAVSWELPGEGAVGPPTAARRVAYDGESDPGDMRPGGTQDGDMGRVGGRETGEMLPEEEQEKQDAEDKTKAMLDDMELVDGDYRILVHVIQAKDLHPEDPNGTADPCIFAEVLGKKQHTRTMWGRTSCVFDHVMWFDFKGLTKQEVETATIRLAVYDVDMITSNDLIGEYSLDAGFVYFREHHEIHNQWIGISDPSNADKEGVQGFLKISVAVMGPHDKRYAWDPRDEEREAAEDADKGVTAKLLMPPAVDRRLEYLVVSAHLAEHLPALDAPQLFGLIQGGIDAFVQVDFGGGVPARTLRVTRKGPSGELDPSWTKQNELWIPVLTPTMSTRVRVTLWDEDFALFGNQLCSTIFLDYARVRRRAVVRKWFNLYGAPVFAAGQQADRMNEYPDVASTYRGRLLLSARVVTDEKEMSGHDEAIHALDAARVMRALRPPTTRYELRALIVSGSELPQRTALLGAIAEGLGLSARDVGVELRIGSYVLMTSSKTPRQRSANWGELLGVGQQVELPSDVDQIPDIFVYLFRGQGTRRVPISFARFTAKEMLERGFTQPAAWLHLDEDASIHAVPADEQPGSILARFGFGTVDAAAGVDDWEGEAEEASLTAPYAVRVNMYQGRNLPATDSNGSTDPWARVQVAGQTARTTALKRTTCPLWYEPMELRLDLPQRSDFFPEMLVQLWDENLFSNVKVSQLRIPLSDAGVPKHRFASNGATDLPDELPRPKWRELWARNRESEGAQGELLIGVQLIALDRLDAVLPPVASLRPRCEDYFVEIVALGMRDLKPYMGFPIYDPCVEFDVGDRKDSGGIKATKHSKQPSGTNPNFGERILLPIKLPINPIYAPSLNITIRDRRLGGWSTPIVGTTSIPLANKYPRPDGRPVGVEGSIITENPHLNELEEGEAGPDPARMAVKAAAKRQQRSAEAKLRSKLRKKAAKRHKAAAAAATAGGMDGEGMGGNASVGGGSGAGDPTSAVLDDVEEAGEEEIESDEYDSEYDESGEFEDDTDSFAGEHSESSKLLSGRHDDGNSDPGAADDGQAGAASLASSSTRGRGVGSRSRRSRGRRSQRLGGSVAGGASGAARSSQVRPVGAQDAYSVSAEEKSVFLQPDAGELSSDVDGVSSDEDDAGMKSQQHLRSRRTGKVKKRAAGSVADEAALLLNRHRVGAAGSARSQGRRSVKRSALAATPAAAKSAGGGKHGLAQPGPAAAAAAAAAAGQEGGVKVVEEGVLGDEAADVDFSVFGAAEDGGGLAAVARSSRDTAAEAAASEAAVDGDLSWLYRHLKRADAAEGMPEEDKAVGYLSQRREYECGLEEALVTAPFETYDVRRGSALPRGSIFGFRLRSSNRRVGVFKGIIRIIKDPRKTPPPVALESLLRPEQYLVRVYIMDGRDFIPTDGNSGDPYLVLTLGDEKVSDRKRYIPKTLSPLFFRCLEIKANLPGPSRLHIAAWDYDYVTFDDFIGETIVDLEDRWFDKRWQSFGLAQQTDERLATRPVEDRTLFSPTFFGSCGQLRMWVDILRPGDAAKYPMIDITPPPPRKFQFRVVVWRARGVATNDKLTNMNDMYARVWLEGMRPMETDTHWRAKGGKASFNWRFLWDVELPYKFAYLNVQLWDRDILKWNDCIAEVQVDLSALFKRAQFQDSVYRIFDDARRHKNGGVDPDEVDPDPSTAAGATAAAAAAAGGSDSDSSTDSESDDDDAAPGEGHGHHHHHHSHSHSAAAGVGGGAAAASVAGSRAHGSRSQSSRQGSVTVRSDGKAPSVYGEDAAPVPVADEAAVSAMASADRRWSKAAKLKSTAAALTSPRPAVPDSGGAIGPGDEDWDEGSAGDPHEAQDDETAAKRRHERMVKAMDKARRKAEKKRRKQRAEARGRIKRSPTEDAENIALDLVTREERERLLQDRDPDRQQTELDTMAVTLADDEEKANEAKETLSTVKSLMGFPQHPKAEHAKWLPCTCNYRNGKYFPTKRGELLVSAELVPEELVQAVPAGRGRSQPNMNPMLPPPAGRMRFSLNPFYLGNAICGPRLFQQCLICFCLLIIILVFALGGPAIQVLVDMYNIIPWPANLIIFAIVFVCLCGPTVLLCLRSCVRQAVLAAIESRPDGPDDHSVLGDKDEERGIEKGGVQDAVGAEAGPGGNFGRSAAEPTSDPNKPDYGYAEDEEELMFLRDAAIISRQRGMKRVKQMGFIAEPEPPAAADPAAAAAAGDSKQLPTPPTAAATTAASAAGAGAAASSGSPAGAGAAAAVSPGAASAVSAAPTPARDVPAAAASPTTDVQAAADAKAASN